MGYVSGYWICNKDQMKCVRISTDMLTHKLLLRCCLVLDIFHICTFTHFTIHNKPISPYIPGCMYQIIINYLLGNIYLDIGAYFSNCSAEWDAGFFFCVRHNTLDTLN